MFDFDNLIWKNVTELDDFNQSVKLDSIIIKSEEFLKYQKFIVQCLESQVQLGQNFNVTISNITGETPTFKTSLLKSVIKECQQLNKVKQVPMTAYLTLKKFKDSIDQTFGEGNKIHKNNLIVIDDLHL